MKLTGFSNYEIDIEKGTIYSYKRNCFMGHINKNDGYIIRAINGDTGQQQFAPKPMRLVATNNDSYLLRGYEVDAQTPFGWQTIDLSDYGFEVRYKDGEVHSCILYMYDRDVRIEYYR